MPRKSRATKTPQTIEKQVDSKAYPVFAWEGKEIQALRDLADEVEHYLNDTDTSHQDLAEALYKVREAQDVVRHGN